MQRLKTDPSFKGWNMRKPRSFYFNPDVSTVTLDEHSDVFDVKSLKKPSKVWFIDSYEAIHVPYRLPKKMLTSVK